MNILITGGAGYKGILLAKKLLELNYKVTILDNFMYGFDFIISIVQHPNLTIRKMDVRNITEKDIKDYDVIYHLAGISGMPACASNPHSAEAINVEPANKLIRLASKEQIIINASTTSMYGYSITICDEKSIIQPVSIYGKTKYEAEKIIQSNKNNISLRFATVFGVAPRMRHDLFVNDFAYKAIHERSIILFAGDAKRTFVHIDDAIDAYIFTLNNFDKMKGDVYNVGDESMNLSKKEITKSIKKLVDFEVIDSSLSDLDNRNFEISFQKIKKLGYSTKKTLDEGVVDIVKLYNFYIRYSPYQVI
jgi:nucleoside-diphosphate-sugar epimerase